MIITLRWSESKGETKVSLPKDWHLLTDISRLDFLQDALHELGDIYNKELDKMHNSGIAATISITP